MRTSYVRLAALVACDVPPPLVVELAMRCAADERILAAVGAYVVAGRVAQVVEQVVAGKAEKSQ